jgi:hypothetical protein
MTGQEGKRRRGARLVAGGILGAVVVVRRRRRVFSEPGLRAFESAPCFRELFESPGDAPRNVDRPPIPKETAAGGRLRSEPRAADAAEVDAGDRRL